MTRSLPQLGRFTFGILLLLLAAIPDRGLAQAGPAAAQTLTLDVATLSRTFVKFTLTPGTLTAQGELYTGDYQVRVWPIPIGSETGRISVRVTREARQRLALGETVSFSGEAVSHSGKVRPVSARATPAGADAGEVRLRIVADGHNLVFQTGYRFGQP